MDKAVHWIGLDVSKKTFDAALVQPGQHYPETPLRTVPAQTFPRNSQGVQQFLEWLDPQVPKEEASMRALMEATGVYSLELCVWLCEQRPQLAPAIINPEQTAAFLKSMALRNKTDRLDARALAFFGVERQPKPYESLSPEHQALRELSRYRDALVAEHVAETNREERGSTSALVRKLHARREQQRKRDIAKIEAEIKRLIEKTPTLQRDFELLTSIPGVGFITAVVILAEMGDLRRFARARQATAFAGVSPRIGDSGTSVHIQPRLCKKGNGRIRQALYLAAMTSVRGKSYLADTYQRLLQHGKKPMVALGAIMRKLLTVMRAVLISEQPFNPGGKPCGKPAV
jgi:transposase